MNEKVQITVQGVLKHLEDGLTRKEIGEKYNISDKDVKILFQHPKLKNKKTKKPVSFVLIDEEELTPEIPFPASTDELPSTDEVDDDPTPEEVEEVDTSEDWPG